LVFPCKYQASGFNRKVALTLPDMTGSAGLASTTRHEQCGMDKQKDVYLSTQARVYLQCHVTTKGDAGLDSIYCWAQLWTLPCSATDSATGAATTVAMCKE
jgi:hypothetical protein